MVTSHRLIMGPVGPFSFTVGEQERKLSMALPPRQWQRGKSPALASTRDFVVLAGEGQRVSMSKRAERALEQLRMAPSPAARRGMARRVHHLPRPVQLELLGALLEKDDWELALMVYKHQDGWYKENVALQARLVAVLRKMEQVEIAEALMVEILGGHGPKQRVQLHCALIESYAYSGLHAQAIEVVGELQQVPYPNTSLRSQRALLRAYTILKSPHEAEKVLVSMKVAGMKPSLDDHKLVLEAFTKGGYLEEMEHLFGQMQIAGLLDQAAFNMTLAAYSQANKQGKMVETLRLMANSGISASVRTWNALCRACPVLTSVCQSLLSETDLQLLFTETLVKEFYCMIKENTLSQSPVNEIEASDSEDGPGFVLRQLLCSSYHLLLLLQSCGAAEGELGVVQALLTLGLLPERTMQPYRIDLHGMDGSTAFVSILLWFRHTMNILEQESSQEASAKTTFGNTVEIVTGWGRHSDEKGKSFMKDVIVALLELMASPFTFERQNRGALVSKKQDVKRWIASCVSTVSSTRSQK